MLGRACYCVQIYGTTPKKTPPKLVPCEMVEVRRSRKEHHVEQRCRSPEGSTKATDPLLNKSRKYYKKVHHDLYDIDTSV